MHMLVTMWPIPERTVSGEADVHGCAPVSSFVLGGWTGRQGDSQPSQGCTPGLHPRWWRAAWGNLGLRGPLQVLLCHFVECRVHVSVLLSVWEQGSACFAKKFGAGIFLGEQDTRMVCLCFSVVSGHGQSPLMKTRNFRWVVH